MPALRPVYDHGNGAASAAGVETLSRFGLTEFAGASGRLWLSYVTAEVSTVVSKLMVASASSAGVSVTFARIALFTVAADGAVTLVARTASDTTIGANPFTSYERPLATAGGFPATYPIVAGRRYALGFLQLAGTPMSLSGQFILDSGEPPIASRIIEAQTDIAASYTGGALTNFYQQPYARARP